MEPFLVKSKDMFLLKHRYFQGCMDPMDVIKNILVIKIHMTVLCSMRELAEDKILHLGIRYLESKYFLSRKKQ